VREQVVRSTDLVVDPHDRALFSDHGQPRGLGIQSTFVGIQSTGDSIAIAYPQGLIFGLMEMIGVPQGLNPQIDFSQCRA
jgi:hypothetical protein